MHFVYVIYCQEFDRYYVGETEDLDKRIEQHNAGFFEKSSTRFCSSWKLIKRIMLPDRTQARAVENYIKSMKSKKFLTQLSNETFYQQFKKLAYQKLKVEIID